MKPTLYKFVFGLFFLFPGIELGAAEGDNLASRVKEILRQRCLECHGGTETQGGVHVLEHATLVKKTIDAEHPDASPLLRVLRSTDDDERMPQNQPALPADEIELIRKWIERGYPEFPADVAVPKSEVATPNTKEIGGEYVLKQILQHQRGLRPDQKAATRYFSCNHLLTRGATRDELNLQREALAKAINHLSREPEIVQPEIVDGETATVFAVDIRKLGWYKPLQTVKDRKATRSKFNLYDLVLLEYPYGLIYEDSETYETLAIEYVAVANLIRPLPYVRSDWFCSVALQPPLYHDLLQLPRDLQTLEKQLGVDSAENVRNYMVQRAGMAVSGVSRNNRAVERHPYSHGVYWKSVDYISSKGRDNLFTDPIDLQGTGGEMIFSLPNGLHGYYLATGAGVRLDNAPTSIVTDKFAEDKTVRNGLACIRCHDRGIKDFRDDVRPSVEHLPGSTGIGKREVLALYPTHEEMDRLLESDRNRYMKAVTKTLGHDQETEALTIVSQRFLDASLPLGGIVGELGLATADDFKSIFRARQFTSLGLVPLTNGGVVRRDMWEDYFDQVAHLLGIGIPIVAIDGLTKNDYRSTDEHLNVRLRTSKKNNTFAPGDDLVITIKNEGKSDAYVELIGTGTRGEKVVLIPAGTLLKSGAEKRFPETDSLKVQSALGEEQITLFASLEEFPAGEILQGEHISDRFVHPFYQVNSKMHKLEVNANPARIVKHTITIETR